MKYDKQIDNLATSRAKLQEEKQQEINITTGSELFDLIIGGGGWGPFGRIVNIIGDSSSFKTYLVCEAIYQAKKAFKTSLKIRYNDAESGFNFNTQELYGYSMEPYVVRTPTIEAFASDLQSFCKEINTKKGELGIYVVDSFDGLASDADIEEFEKRLEAYEDDKDFKKGSYDMSKQKFSSKLFRTLSQNIIKANVLLIIISQIRDNVGVSFGQKWTVSGGQALKFYSTIRVFLQLVDKYSVEDRQIGATVKATGMKVRAKHPFREVFVNMLFEFGVDAVSTHIDYLYDLRDNYGKLKEASVINNIAWTEDTKPVNSVSLKEFLQEKDLLEEATMYIKDNLGKDGSKGRMSQGNIIEYIKLDPELYSEYLSTFGVIDRDSLIQHVLNNDMEDEIAQKAVAKWFAVEKRIKPVRKQKTLKE
jgi:recombination protein RecA